MSTIGPDWRIILADDQRADAPTSEHKMPVTLRRVTVVRNTVSPFTGSCPWFSGQGALEAAQRYMNAARWDTDCEFSWLGDSVTTEPNHKFVTWSQNDVGVCERDCFCELESGRTVHIRLVQT